MSAFTDRVYAEFLALNGGSGRPVRVSQRTRPTLNHYAQWRRAYGAFVSGGMGVPPMVTEPVLAASSRSNGPSFVGTASVSLPEVDAA